MSWRSTRASARSGHAIRQTAIIDLGSNSWRLVVFTYSPGDWWKRTDELYETVRIGAGLGASGRLGEAAVARGLETLAVFERFCRAGGLHPDDVHAVATSAIRDATNREDFLSAAREATGLEVEVFSAEQEAHYGYVAAVNTSTLSDGVVLDIGGGSMQLIQVQDRRAGALGSFQLGAVRLTEQFLADGEPARKKDLQRVRAHVRGTLEGVDWLARSGDRMVGIGGAVRNLAAAAQRTGDGQFDLGVQGFVITAEQLGELVQMLAAMPAAERGNVPGIKPGRGDIILASAVALETVVEIGG
ncbi:MAG: Ppx/GppA phosphatase family protein, partial [Solirubrobacteraceae bacterium]